MEGSRLSPVLVTVLVIVIAVAIIVAMGIVSVPVGHVGLVIRFGGIDRMIYPGHPNIVIPGLEKTEFIDTRENSIEFDAATFSKQQQDVKISITIIYMLDRSKVGEMYKTIGTRDKVEKKLILPKSEHILKTVVSEYPTDMVHRNRNEISEKVISYLKKEIPEAVSIVAVNLKNITFSEEYTKAIEDKQRAEQMALKAEYDRQRALKEKEIAQIQGEAEKIRQQNIGAALTPLVIQNKWINKWDGKMPQVVTGDSGSLIYNMQNMGR